MKAFINAVSGFYKNIDSPSFFGGLSKHLAEESSPIASTDIPIAAESNADTPRATPHHPIEVAATSGIVRAASAAIGQPCEVIRITAQARPTIPISQLMRDLYAHKGAAGFYATYPMNALKLGARDLYRMPIQIYLPGMLPGNFETKHPVATQAILAATLTTVDIGINTPTGRIAAIQINSAHADSLTKTARNIVKSIPLKELTVGWKSHGIMQMAGWGSFLGADMAAMSLLHRRSPNPTTGEKIATYAATGIVVTAINTPFSFVTMLTQRAENPLPLREVPKAMVKLIDEKGLAIVNRGFAPRMAVGVISTMVSCGLRRHFEVRPQQEAGQIR